MTYIAMPLPIESPFTPGKMADLPFSEVLTPFLSLFLLLRIAVRRDSIPSSPLRVPLILWFGLIVLTYFRNPLFLNDLLGKEGTGAIYHIIYPFFLCGIFYLAAATISKTRYRIILTAKIFLAVMIAGILLMSFMFITGFNIPLITGGRGPWTVRSSIYPSGTVYRITSMSSYSAMLILALLCFGRHLRKSLQLLIFSILVVTLVLGGGRTFLIYILVCLILSAVTQRQSRWLISSMAFLVILLSLFVIPNVNLPRTTKRIVDFSQQQSRGRLSMARTSWYIIKKKPILGYGYGQLQKRFADIEMSKEFASGEPHAGFLAVMTFYGVVGLGIFLWLFFTAIRTGWELYRNIEDGILKQLMLWLTLHLSAYLAVFFVSAQIERNVFAYAGMGIIAATYAMYMKRGTPVDGSDGDQRFGAESMG